VGRVVALIPAFNEEDSVARTVAAVKDWVDEVVVIDDGSSDKTTEAAEEAGARVIRLPTNGGKGSALNTGLAKTQGDVVLMIDADLGDCAAETRALLEPVLSGQADMSIAAMKAPKGHKGGFGAAVKLSRWAIKRMGGEVMSTPMSGQRAIKRALLEDIGGFETRFGVETALTIDALRKGYRVVEIALPLNHRVTGRNLRGFIHRGRQFVDIARAVWRRRRK
jgi:glycosyltransferase involved in cell wall biosynthesis